MLANRSVQGSIRASRVLTGALAGQSSFHAPWPRRFYVEIWSARAPTIAREGACAPKKENARRDSPGRPVTKNSPFSSKKMRSPVSYRVNLSPPGPVRTCRARGEENSDHYEICTIRLHVGRAPVDGASWNPCPRRLCWAALGPAGNTTEYPANCRFDQQEFGAVLGQADELIQQH